MHDATQPVTPTPASGSAPTGVAAADLTGQTIGDFQIIRRLGQGGMGHVYLAEQRSLKRKVALKFLRSDLAANPTALSRFRREAEAVARVTHANIVQVYSINADVPPYFMALEYVEGRNLRDYITRKGPVELPVALTIMRQVAAALQRASESNIVHRDIKPENILLTRKGEVKVADFGLSRDLTSHQDLSLTQTGVTMGTPLYMSPEQAQGSPLDARSDIYSFGVTCYHMLSGQPPFRGQTAIEVALKHVNEQPRPLGELRPGLPPTLVHLVNRMMNKDPARRPQSGREVLRELNQPAGLTSADNPFAGLAAPLSDATAVVPPAVGSHRTRWPWLVGMLGILLAAGSGVALRRARAPQLPRAASDDHPNLPVVSDRERRLLAAVELYTNPPPKTPEKIRQGAGHCVGLGILYWEQRRYDDARRFFSDLERDPNSPATYKTIARFGLAVTYSLSDDVDRSNKLFLEARGAGGRPFMLPGSLPAEDLVNLRYWVSTALDRNATRPPANKEIDDMRRELRWRPNMGGGGRAQ